MEVGRSEAGSLNADKCYTAGKLGRRDLVIADTVCSDVEFFLGIYLRPRIDDGVTARGLPDEIRGFVAFVGDGVYEVSRRGDFRR